jgi:soluble lytic murein transglycosylase-like protein
MKLKRVIWGGVMLSLLLASATVSEAAHHGRKKSGKHAAKSTDEVPEAEVLQTNEMIVKLLDGTSMRLVDARETSQGVWYQRGAIAYLVERERIKSIERGSAEKTVASMGETPVPPVELPMVAATPRSSAAVQPVWIYMVGGAKVEADNATESPAGVWFSRGPLNIFIERSRIERVEREDLESLAKSNSSKKERGWTSGNAKIDSLIRQNGAKHGVDPYLIFCVMEQESHFSARALSPKGARGLMQLMPGTGARFGVRNAFNPAENIAGGTRYLKQLLDRFNNRVDLVLASYNAGEGAVVKFGHKVPPYRETRDYVRKISYRYQGSKKADAPKKAEANHIGQTATSRTGR